MQPKTIRPIISIQANTGFLIEASESVIVPFPSRRAKECHRAVHWRARLAPGLECFAYWSIVAAVPNWRSRRDGFPFAGRCNFFRPDERPCHRPEPQKWRARDHHKPFALGVPRHALSVRAKAVQ